MRALANILLIIAALAATAAHARSPVPIVARENVPLVTGSTTPADADTIRKTIVRAGATSVRKWDIVPAPDGKGLLATTRWDNHMLVVRVESSGSSYSVRYEDSVNLKYSIKDGKPVIHPAYNKVVEDLINAIRAEMLKL